MLIWGKSWGRQRIQYCDLPPTPPVAAPAIPPASDALPIPTPANASTTNPTRNRVHMTVPPVPAVSGHSSGHWSDASRLEVIESDQSDSACPQRPGSYPQRTPQEL